jgi:hypothetical protein
MAIAAIFLVVESPAIGALEELSSRLPPASQNRASRRLARPTIVRTALCAPWGSPPKECRKAPTIVRDFILLSTPLCPYSHVAEVSTRTDHQPSN